VSQKVARGYPAEPSEDPHGGGAEVLDDAHATQAGAVSMSAEVWLLDCHLSPLI
jgi:hypothetical protein